jgi:hypothetical protein
MLKNSYHVGKIFVKRQHVAIAWLQEEAAQAMYQRVRHFMRHDVLREAGKHGLAGNVGAGVGTIGTKIAEQDSQ